MLIWFGDTLKNYIVKLLLPLLSEIIAKMVNSLKDFMQLTPVRIKF